MVRVWWTCSAIQFFNPLVEVVWIKPHNKVVHCSKSGWYADLDVHAKVGRHYQDSEACLEDSKDALNHISCLCMPKVVQLLSFHWPEN